MKRVFIIFFFLFPFFLLASSSDTFLKTGNKFLKEGENIKAAQEFEKFLVKYPQDPLYPDALLLYASALIKLEKYSLARRSLQLLLDLYPNSSLAPEAFLKIGKTYEKEKQLKEAINIYQDFLSLYPTNKEAPTARYKIVLLTYQKGKNFLTPSGLESLSYRLEELINLYPTHPLSREARNLYNSLRILLGDYYFRKNQWGKAQVIYEGILRKTPHHSRKDYLLFRIGYTFNMQRQWKEAINYYTRVVKEFPRSRWADNACERIASIYSGFLNREDLAIQWLEYLWRNYPQSEERKRAVWILASLYENQKDYDNAIRCYKWLISLDPKRVAAYKARERIRSIEEKRQKEIEKKLKTLTR